MRKQRTEKNTTLDEDENVVALYQCLPLSDIYYNRVFLVEQ
jgi:hypothetical protein